MPADPALARLHRVGKPHRHRIEASLRCELVYLRFTGKGRLRIAEAAEGAGAQLVGVDRAATDADIRNTVWPARHQHGEGEDVGAFVGKGAAVKGDLGRAG